MEVLLCCISLETKTHHPWSCLLIYSNQGRRVLRRKLHILAQFWEIIICFILSFPTAIASMVKWVNFHYKGRTLSVDRGNTLTNFLYCVLQPSRKNSRMHSYNCFYSLGDCKSFVGRKLTNRLLHFSIPPAGSTQHKLR